MKITNFGRTYNVLLETTQYYDRNFAIRLVCENGEPYGNLTVNLGEPLPPYTAYVDTNNMPSAEQFIKDNDLGTFTGKYKKSGYCTYPLYKFKEDLQ